MFPSTDDQTTSPQGWRAKLARAAGLVVAFVTLDGYGPFASAFLPDDETSRDLHQLHPDPHGHGDDRNRQPLQPLPRRRGHGIPPIVSGVCVSAPERRATGTAPQRASDTV